MHSTEPEISGVAIVLVGNFNPAIFTPAWFALHEILPPSVAESAKVQAVLPELSAFSTEWLTLQATTERFSASTQHGPNIRVLDLAMNVFKEHLPHTPIRAFGINREVHFATPSRAVRDHVGRMLAPLDPWGEWAETLQLSGESSGMVSLTMRQTQPDGRPPGGRIEVTIEPSVRIDNGRSGIYVRVNDHYEIDQPKSNRTNCVELLKLLEDDFESSINRADGIVNHIMSLAVKE